ncbi:DUF2017 family protein [Microbacterium sp. NPDC058345]|uniref:DUF2017 family protein n=1 Tax=Microbacterium sp. NPDC058345 TaxID=3346455 RepID=UPI003661AF71
MSASVVRIGIAVIEARNLVALIDELIAVIDDPRSMDDPGVARLAPDAYPGDDAASTEFREATRDALIDRRHADATTVRRSLASIADAEDADPGGGFREHRLSLSDAQADAWMRTLAALRLVVASRLGIETADDHDPEDPRFGVYDWLGYRLELLVRAADEQDPRG